MLPLIVLLVFGMVFAQQIWVVERERGALAVIEGNHISEIKDLGDLNHATLKFKDGRAYLVSRDGYLSLIDIKTRKILRRVKVGSSTIGLTFCGNRVAVANYEPKTVVILSEDLEPLKEIRTGSRNVGIKSWRGILVFSLMDRDEVWVLDCGGKLLRRFKVSPTPFDALIANGRYLVGFFRAGKVGLLDLRTMSYREIALGSGREAVLKVPHFGTWAVWKGKAYIPAVGERKVYVLDLVSMKVLGSVDVPGLPVFAVLSPDGRYVAVNFSGDKEDFVALISRKEGRVVGSRRVGRRVIHLRFSPDGKHLYLSSYYENKVKKVTVPDLKVVEEIPVPTPSGLFIGG